MDANLLDDLRRRFKGCVRVDLRHREIYATDASLFELTPAAVAMPRDLAELQKIVRYAQEHHLPITMRGAATSQNGAPLSHSLIVDLATHFRSMTWREDFQIHVGAGVPYVALQQFAEERGRRLRFPFVTPESTIGGIFNTLGQAAHFKQCRWVWSDGSSDLFPTDQPSTRLQQLQQQLLQLLLQPEWKTTQPWPKHRFDRVGYRIAESIQNDSIDWMQLLAGTEGTLAILTEAVLETEAIPPFQAIVALTCNNVDVALRAALELRSFQPVRSVVYDRRLLSLSQSEEARSLQWEAEAILFLEFEGESATDVHTQAVAASNWLTSRLDWIQQRFFAVEPQEYLHVRQLEQSICPPVYRYRQGAYPIPFMDEIGIDPLQLQAFWGRVQTILREQTIAACLQIHLFEGIIRLRPIIDPCNAEELNQLWPLCQKIYDLVWEFGGTISAGRGIGLVAAPWASQQLGESLPWVRKIKAIFDPSNIFNPGKLFDLEASRPAWPMRSLVQPTIVATNTEIDSKPARQPLLLWQESTPITEASHCNGCGTCRTEADHSRMCPLFRVVHHEAATPRAKANLIRNLEKRDQHIGNEDARKIVDWCVNCKMCKSECPGEIDIPKLMLEAKAQHFRDFGSSRTNWILGHAESFAKLGSRFARTSNWLLGQGWSRWIIEKLIGLSRKRTLPAFARQNFFKYARQQGWTVRTQVDTYPKERRLVYFVDLFATYNDPSIAVATIQVLQHLGYGVYVPELQRGCGMDALAVGDTDRARDILQHNLRALAGLAREGFRIICSEPTAALFFREDAKTLLDDPDVELVASCVMELTAFLHELLQAGVLKPPTKMLNYTIGHHVPCHIKALGEVHGPLLLEYIPGIKIAPIDKSCSGMAGLYGMGKKQFEYSIQAGEPLKNRLIQDDLQYGSTECSSCRMQMEHLSQKRTLHPVQWFAYAYGLMPELERRLQVPIRHRLSH